MVKISIDRKRSNYIICRNGEAPRQYPANRKTAFYHDGNEDFDHTECLETAIVDYFREYISCDETDHDQAECECVYTKNVAPFWDGVMEVCEQTLSDDLDINFRFVSEE